MKEKVFSTLFRLISSGQLTVEEAYYLMETLFKGKDKDANDNPFGVIHQVQPYTPSDTGLHPWWDVNPTLTTTSTGDTVTTTYTAAQSKPSVYTTTASINDPNVGTVSCSNPLLGVDSDTTKNCIDTIE